MPAAYSPPQTLRDLDPHAVYTAAEVARVFRVTGETVVGWASRGHLRELPRHGGRSRHRFLGADVLLYAGRSGASQGPPTETPAERMRRAAADREAMRELGRRKG